MPRVYGPYQSWLRFKPPYAFSILHVVHCLLMSSIADVVLVSLQALEGKKGWSRTRAAITVALGEMSVLESAWTAWGEVSAVLKDLSARA